ncbi:hypothetical protein LIA77_11965 [Sarocladium implicatum]|nr:hypothetical protein LIA77_11965 [Sarocladium implicatum]
MALLIPAVLSILSGIIGCAATETGNRQPLAARRAAVAQRQNAPDDCTFFDSITSVDQDCAYLASFWGISTEDFISWNPQVGASCQNIVVGEEYCVERNWGLPVTTSTTSANVPEPTSNVPSPTQSGIVNGCLAYYQAVDGDDCSKIVAAHGTFSLSDFIAWNPAVGSGCSGLWLGYWYCVAIEGTPTKPPTPPSTTTAGNGISTPTPTQAGMVANCNKFHLIKDTTTCQGIADYNKVSLADVLKWNTGLNSDCSNLWLGTYACAGVIGGSTPPPSTTTSAGNGIATPTPTQPGMVNNCNKFHLVKDTTTCQGIADYNKVSLADVFKWNTGVNKDCTNLRLGSYACAGVIGGGGSNPPPSTTTSAGNGIATPTPTQPGMVSNCNKFHLIKDTTTCQGIADYNKVSLSDVLKWNTGINKDCTNLWLGTYACAGVIGGGSSPPPTTTTSRPGNGIATPTPTQPGMVSNCNKFHLVKDTTTCQGIADYNKVSLADIFKWNTSLNSGCTNLQLGVYACAGVIGGGSSPPPTTTSSRPGNGIATPTPTQPGMVSNCNKFHLVKDTTTCQGMADYNRVSLSNIKKWNTGLNSACSNLWLGTYACVGVIQSRILAVDVAEESSSSWSGLTSSPIPTIMPPSAEPTYKVSSAPSADSSTLSPAMVQVPVGTPRPLP